MSAAENILVEARLAICDGEARLAGSDGGGRMEFIANRHLAIEAIARAEQRLQAAKELIERELYSKVKG